MNVLQLIIIFAMVGLNAFFAAYELSLASVTVGRLKQAADERKSGAAAALRMKNRMEASLAVVQLGITLVGAIAAAVGGAGVDEVLAPRLEASLGVSETVADAMAIAIFVLPLAAVTIVLGELVPKTFAIHHAEYVCRRLSPVMELFAYTVHPLVASFEWVTKKFVGVTERLFKRDPGQRETNVDEPAAAMHELVADARMLRMKRVISPQQERVIQGADRLANLKVRDIMVPADEIKMLYADGPLTEHIVTVHLEAHTRFLVTERPGDPQAIIGYVNVKDLFFLAKSHPHNPSVREITRPLPILHPEMMIGDALARMMGGHLHLAMVKDRNGAVLGMITLEDIIEEVVGDIQDEFDRLPRSLIPVGRQWVAGGGVTLANIREAMGRPTFGGDSAPTVSLDDYLHAIDPDVHAGTLVEVDGARILVRKMRREKVMEAVLQPVASSEPAQAERV